MITPLSERLTFLTCSACSSIDIFLWITPIPPSRAIAIAILYSVTVSIAAEITGIDNLILSVKLTFKSTFLGNISLLAGTNSTSSNVKPSF